MKYILIALLVLAPTVDSYADDETMFEQQDYNYADYKPENALPKASVFDFENTTSQTETAVIANTDPVQPASVGPILLDDVSIDELSYSEINSRTQAGFSASNAALPSDEGKISVTLRRK